MGSKSTKKTTSKAIATLFLAVLFSGLIFPEATRASQEESSETFVVEEVKYEGLWRTHRSVLDEELVFEIGLRVSREKIKKSIQRIRNTSLFRKVNYELEPLETKSSDPNSRVVLIVRVDERWTLLPLFQLNQGGGSRRLILGASDINVFGRYLELGVQYERLGEANSFYGWLRKPQFLGYRLAVGATGGTQNQRFLFFDEEGKLNNGFLMTTNLFNLFVEKEWNWWFYTSGEIQVSESSFSLDYLPESARRRQQQRGLPATETLLSGNLNIQFGRLDEHNYRYDGKAVSLGYGGAADGIVSDSSYQQFDVSMNYFELLPWSGNLATELSAGFTTADAPQRQYRLGGLDSVRGFIADQFAGDSYWLMNAEYRIPSVDTRWLVLQHTAFVDVGGVGSLPGGLQTSRLEGDDFWRVRAASTGIGLRIISPKIYTFLIRIDYALPIKGRVRLPISFGAGQFF